MQETLRLVRTHRGLNTELGSEKLPPITYYWTVPLILDHSYLVGKLTSPKIGDTKVSEI